MNEEVVFYFYLESLCTVESGDEEGPRMEEGKDTSCQGSEALLDFRQRVIAHLNYQERILHRTQRVSTSSCRYGRRSDHIFPMAGRCPFVILTDTSSATTPHASQTLVSALDDRQHPRPSSHAAGVTSSS